MFYASANWDTEVFEAPSSSTSRSPNPHIAFGGGGIHHCLGNQFGAEAACCDLHRTANPVYRISKLWESRS